MHCQKHNQQIQEIILNINLKREERQLCLQCQKEYKQNQDKKGISIQEAKQIITNKFGQLLPEYLLTQLQLIQINQKKNSQNYLDVLVNFINEWQLEIIDIFNIKLDANFLEQFDEIQQYPNNWKMKKQIQIAQEIQSKHSSATLKIQQQISNFQELSKIFSVEEDLKQIEKQCSNIYKKLNQQQQLQDLQQNQEINKLNPSNNQTEQIQNKQIINQNFVTENQKNQENSDLEDKYNQIQYSLIDNKIKSEHCCLALAFNKDSNILVSGDKGNIKIWEFIQGNLCYKNILIRNIQSSITCLLFSKFCNSFVSADYQKNITCWKQICEKNYIWVGSQNDQVHQNCIHSIIINKQENQLISCSKDRTIRIWMIDFKMNKLNYEYTLQQKHENDVVSICLNSSETTLISCSCDKSILAWEKDFNSKWYFKYTIAQSFEDYGHRLSFINDNIFIWVSCYQSFITVFKCQNQKFVDESIKRLQLQESRDLEAFFPIIYNRKKNLLLVKHGEFVYLIKTDQNGQLQKMIELDCVDSQSIGTISHDARYLIIWINQTQEFRIIKLNYS